MSVLFVIGALLIAVVLVGAIFVGSRRMTENKSSNELAQRMPDGSAVNHDSSGGMWDGAAGGGGD